MEQEPRKDYNGDVEPPEASSRNSQGEQEGNMDSGDRHGSKGCVGASEDRLEALRESEFYARAALDGLSSNIAILDARGRIEFVNKTWRDFAEANGPASCNVCEGADYLAICDSGEGAEAEDARKTACGIRDVLAGRAESFKLEYPCHSPSVQRWFSMNVTRFPGAGPTRAIVVHENVTQRKLAEEALRVESRRRIGYLEALSQIQTEIASQRSLDLVLEKVVRSAIDILEKAACAILLLDPDGQTLTCRASRGVLCSEYDKAIPDSMQSLAERVLQTKKTTEISDSREEGGLYLPTLENERLPGAAASAPIMIGQDRIVGVLAVYSYEPQTLNEEELHCLNALAGSIGVSVANADAFAESEKQRNWLDSVLRVVPSAVIMSQKPGDRLALANDRAEGLLGRKLGRGMPLTEIPEKCGIFELDGSPIPIDRFPLYRASAYGEPTDLIEMMVIRPDGERRIFQGNALPMYDENGNISGAVGIMEDITRLKAMQTTIQEALAREHYLSETVQKALIPDITEHTDGLVVNRAYVPAYAKDLIGGDFFDVFAPNAGQVSMVIGDVSGKGLRGAVLTALVRYTLPAYSYEDPSPKHLIEKLNNVVALEVAPEEFATLFYGLWDVKQQSLGFVNAGHEPPLYLPSSESEVIELSSTGIPVGALPGALYREHSLRLNSGDRLLLYTDGVTEARGDKDFFGLEALKDFFVAKRHESPSEFTAQLMDRLIDHSNGHLRDDIAILLISASPASASA